MRTPKATRAKPKTASIMIMATIAALAARLPMITQRERGAACRRFQSPVRRCMSTVMPASMPMKRMNCTHMPAKEWAMLL